MPLRFVEVRLPPEFRDEVHAIVDESPILDRWCLPADDGDVHQLLMESQNVEPLLDALRSRFGDERRIIIMPVEATLPRIAEEPVATPVEDPDAPKAKGRVSREELYEDIGDGIALNPAFLAFAFLSAIVACIGLLRDDVVAIIGAMVIAPLLGPNVALALGTTLGDTKLIKKALKAGTAGIGVSFLVALGAGYVFGVDSTSPEIAARTAPDLGHMVLALASGVAGGLAFTTGAPASLIGVMVAVALLPPLATGAMLLASGQPQASIGAFVLLGTNLVAVNLAGIATFLAQGIRPLWSDEKENANRAAKRAFLLWGVLLALFAAALGRIQGAW